MFRSNFKYKKDKDKSDFAIFDPHSEPGFNKTSKRFKKILGNLGNDYIGIVSIDPGTVNIGFYIMFFWDNGKTQSHCLERFDFTTADKEDCDSAQTVQRYNEATSTIDEYLDIFKHVHYILIESQLSINPDAVRMSQHLITYFSLKMKDSGVKPLTIEISPELKTRVLGGPVGKLSKKESKAQAKTRRKKWCQKKAEEIMTLTEDPFVEKVIKRRNKKGEGKSKQDDMGDVVCQAWAWIKICSQHEWWKLFSDVNIIELINITEYSHVA